MGVASRDLQPIRCMQPSDCTSRLNLCTSLLTSGGQSLPPCRGDTAITRLPACAMHLLTLTGSTVSTPLVLSGIEHDEACWECAFSHLPRRCRSLACSQTATSSHKHVSVWDTGSPTTRPSHSIGSPADGIVSPAWRPVCARCDQSGRFAKQEEASMHEASQGKSSDIGPSHPFPLLVAGRILEESRKDHATQESTAAPSGPDTLRTRCFWPFPHWAEQAVQSLATSTSQVQGEELLQTSARHRHPTHPGCSRAPDFSTKFTRYYVCRTAPKIQNHSNKERSLQ